MIVEIAEDVVVRAALVEGEIGRAARHCEPPVLRQILTRNCCKTVEVPLQPLGKKKARVYKTLAFVMRAGRRSHRTLLIDKIYLRKFILIIVFFKILQLCLSQIKTLVLP
jgi:hypothetical protein